MDKKVVAGIMSVVFALIVGVFIAYWFDEAYSLEWYMPLGIGIVLTITLSALFYNLLLNK